MLASVRRLLTAVDVPFILLDRLLTYKPQRRATTHTAAAVSDRLLAGCAHLLRVLARHNDVIQRRIFERFEDLLSVDANHCDIALLLRDVSLFLS